MSDHREAHKHFAIEAFNAAWGLIDKPERTVAEAREMIRLAEVSYHHWSALPDHTAENISIGTWQLSRVYSLAGEPATALHYGEECLRASAGLSPFYLAYAHEAIARAAALSNDGHTSSTHLSEAESLLAGIPEEDNRTAIKNDLSTITADPPPISNS